MGEDRTAQDLRRIQREVSKWAQQNFGDNNGFGDLAPLLGIVEEVGELCHVRLKGIQGIRGYDNPSKVDTEERDAVGDIMIYLSDYCARRNIDLLEVLSYTWEKIVAKRNWKENPENADRV